MGNNGHVTDVGNLVHKGPDLSFVSICLYILLLNKPIGNVPHQR